MVTLSDEKSVKIARLKIHISATVHDKNVIQNVFKNIA
jgi:hypothetical protein